MKEVTRYLMAVSSALAAVNVFLMSYPGDAVSQSVLLIVGAATAFVGALAYQLSRGLE